uniref:Protein kinase domain-containing protein n=2 Tax=viral metagenome TaxID=1070528 RepID=A0A6C0DGW9_9ZZZZ
MAHKLYPKIIFPINFNQIGLNYEMTYDTFSNSNKVGVLRPLCQAASRDSIQCVVNPVSSKSELLQGGELHLRDGSRYRIEKTLASGSFGTTAIVRNIATGLLFCLKRQMTYDEDDELDCYKEAMMHHILDIKTRQFADHPSNLIPRLYHVVHSKNRDTVIYFIMDLMSTSLHSRLANIRTYHGRLFEFVRCLAQIRPTLEILYKNGSYTHGDLHMGNIMYDQLTGSYKLIDYGFSRIIIGSGAKSEIFSLNEIHNNKDDASRDLTQLITSFELINKINELQFTEGSFEHRVQQLIENVAYNGRCSGLGHSDHTHNFVGKGWSASYRYFNTHTNVNGTYNALKEAINDLPSSNATPSSISRRPSVSSSSSVSASASASAAPRTPRAGRAASAAVREEVGKTNEQNPGCMLFLLLMMLLAMRGAVWIYHGKGGRDPNIIMNYPLLNQPVISSKHATYPAISFPTHSIQMKPLSNSKNSKTRSNRSVSKRNNTRRRSYKVIKATIEDFNKLSLASFYHFMRHAFPKQEDDTIKEMLREAAMVPLQRPDVFSQIVEAVKNNDIDHMMEILQLNKIDVSKLGLEIEPYQEIWNTILDAYFEEKDSPFELLQTLLHVGDQVDDFLKRYHSADKETKKMMVMQTCITASDAPELMLE